jgi:hypothetical protein
VKLQDLKDWRSNRKFARGVELLCEAGTNTFLVDLCQKFGDTAYTREKLEDALDEIYRDLKDIPEIQPGQEAMNLPLNVPDEVQKLQAEKGELFRKAFSMRKVLKQEFEPMLRKLIKHKQRLTVKEVCEMMEQCSRRARPVPFSITYVTYDEQRNTGGELRTYDHAIMVVLNSTGSKAYSTENALKLKNKKPNHWRHGTRNIMVQHSGETRKVHIWLILEFNGCEVDLADAG